MSYVCTSCDWVLSTKDRQPFISEEFVALLKKHNIECDEKYLWE